MNLLKKKEEACTSGQNRIEIEGILNYATVETETIDDASNREIIGEKHKPYTSEQDKTETEHADTTNSASHKEIKHVGFSENIMRKEAENVVETQDKDVLKESTGKKGVHQMENINETKQASRCPQTNQREKKN